MRDYKLVVLGAGGIGKSAITAQYVQGTFLDIYDPTIEDSYHKETIVDGRAYSLEILDTAGIEQFTAMRELYIRNSDGFILTYSITSAASLDELDALHEQVVRLKDNMNVPLVLVGNKRDLASSQRQVSYEQGRALANAWGNVPFFETSAKDFINITESFERLVQSLARRDSAIGSSFRNSSIYGSVDSESHISKPVGSNRLRMKQSLARLREKKSIRRLVSMASMRPAKELKQRASQFFGMNDKKEPHNASVDRLAAQLDALPLSPALSPTDSLGMPTTEEAVHTQTMAQLSSAESQDDLSPEGAILDLSQVPEIPVVKSKKSKCIIM